MTSGGCCVCTSKKPITWREPRVSTTLWSPTARPWYSIWLRSFIQGFPLMGGSSCPDIYPTTLMSWAPLTRICLSTSFGSFQKFVTMRCEPIPLHIFQQRSEKAFPHRCEVSTTRLARFPRLHLHRLAGQVRHRSQEKAVWFYPSRDIPRPTMSKDPLWRTQSFSSRLSQQVRRRQISA